MCVWYSAFDLNKAVTTAFKPPSVELVESDENQEKKIEQVLKHAT